MWRMRRTGRQEGDVTIGPEGPGSFSRRDLTSRDLLFQLLRESSSAQRPPRSVPSTRQCASDHVMPHLGRSSFSTARCADRPQSFGLDRSLVRSRSGTPLLPARLHASPQRCTLPSLPPLRPGCHQPRLGTNQGFTGGAPPMTTTPTLSAIEARYGQS